VIVAHDRMKELRDREALLKALGDRRRGSRSGRVRPILSVNWLK
jgi:hypothetical protein